MRAIIYSTIGMFLLIGILWIIPNEIRTKRSEHRGKSLITQDTATFRKIGLEKSITKIKLFSLFKIFSFISYFKKFISLSKNFIVFNILFSNN